MQVIAQGVTVNHKISYVKNSQYWFIIEFDYADTGIVPVFQYTVQINPIQANFFRVQDLLQKLFQTIDPVNVPQTQGTQPTSSNNNQVQLPSGGFRSTGGGLRSEPERTVVIDENGNETQVPVGQGQLFP